MHPSVLQSIHPSVTAEAESTNHYIMVSVSSSPSPLQRFILFGVFFRRQREQQTKQKTQNIS